METSGSSVMLVAPVEEWLKLHKEGRFTAHHIRDYWRTNVPEIYSPRTNCNCLRISYDEELAEKVLFQPLDQFICAGDPVQVYQSIRQLDSPPSLCGKVFKHWDPTYGCRDCGMDPTCVLCADCFKHSKHSKHRYKIGSSTGGGYCDCGDREAWKSDVFCEIHAKGEMQDESQNPVKKLAPDLVERIYLVLDCVVQYAEQLLTYTEGYSLPSDLDIKDSDREPTSKGSLFEIRDTFVTMLYNDETHTYDQVITTLERAIGVVKKDAVAFATSIDREGRCIVRCSNLQQCTQAKTIMEKQTSRSPAPKALKVQVVRAYIIAHQTFASRLLNWLQNILESAQAFRFIFSDIVSGVSRFSTDMVSSASREPFSVMESIFWKDTLMWKSARIQWHRLFISGMLMDMESKKIFARAFTKHYAKMMQDFIVDDHEHSVCIVSLGVQVFTMPTIAHMLIAEEAVLAKLLMALLAECKEKVKDGRLSLDNRNTNKDMFRRMQYVLFDLKYLLGVKPEVWTDELRKGFLRGFEHLVNLLAIMQGMDCVVRQVGQHMEYEPEWESAFNLHIKLANVIPLVIEWAVSDRITLIKAFRILLKALGSRKTNDMSHRYVRELLNYSVSCIEYDVSSAPVSIHLPLSRLVAGLALHLGKYDLDYNSTEFSVKDKPSPLELMEPVLRTQVLIAQVNAGMWRRNGFSLSNQIYFYHNVKCRQEMLDRDITLLQVVATLIESNEFLVHLLNRFNLINWARVDYETNYLWSRDEENLKQTVSLAEKFLLLVLTIVAERYTPGIGRVTDEDRLKNEIVQLLCVENMPHSVLNKELPEGANHETGMEKVIDEVAEFKKASDASKGYYSLKDEYYDHYNLFFYHYTPEEQSKSEVAQRRRKQAAKQEECCPPPLLPQFCENYTLIINILQCDIFLDIMHTVLTRLNNPKSQSVCESQFQVVLHLIGHALHEEKRYYENQDPYFRFTRLAAKHKLLELLEGLVGVTRVATHKDLLAWTIRKYREVVRLTGEDDGTQQADRGKQEGSSTEECTVAASTSAAGEDDNSETVERKKQKAAIARKKAILAKMANMQQNFIKINEVLFKETSSSDQAVPDTTPALFQLSTIPENMVAVGPTQTLTVPSEPVYTCILCHQDGAIAPTSEEGAASPCRAMVLGTLISRSTVLSRDRTRQIMDKDNHDPLILPSDLHWGTHTTSCGHAMHAQCWQRYFHDVLQREQRRPYRYRFRQNLSFDIEKAEYLCPLCESLCNSALPILPSVTAPLRPGQKLHTEPSQPQITISQWLTGLQIVLDKRVKRSNSGSGKGQSTSDNSLLYVAPKMSVVQKKLAQETSESVADIFSQMFAGDAVTAISEFPPNVDDLSWDFVHAVYKNGLDVNHNMEDKRIGPMMWSSLVYTIRTLEETQRNGNRALLTSISSRLLDSLAALVKQSAYAPIFIANKQPNLTVESIAFQVLGQLLDSSSAGPSCILEWDAVSVLVTTSLTLPSLFSKWKGTAKGGLQDHFVMQICLLMHIVQMLLTYNENDVVTSMDVDTPSTSQEAGTSGVKSSPVEYHNKSHGISDTTSNSKSEVDAAWLVKVRNECLIAASRPPQPDTDAQSLLEYVKGECLPYLRCTALFYHLLTEVPVPEELKSSVWVPESEFYCLLRYLGLPSFFKPMFEYQIFGELISNWCKHPRIPELMSNLGKPGSGGVQSWLKVNQLVRLPRDYSELINTVSQFPCPASSGDDSRSPTMCLVCGKMLCSQSYCCQTELGDHHQMVGACTHHAHFCGAGTSMFLHVRDCRVLLLSGRIKGCYIAAPYLDEYGEADTGLKRGNPLYLDQTQYENLHTMWLSHAIPNTIAHTMESTTNILPAEWYLL